MARKVLTLEIRPSILKNVAETEIPIGRNGERKLLREILASGKSELVALYGRRRVGKTFLVRALFSLPPAVTAEGAEAPANAPQGAAKGAALESRPGLYLEVTGTKNAGAAVQRRRFREADAISNRRRVYPLLPAMDRAGSHGHSG